MRFRRIGACVLALGLALAACTTGSEDATTTVPPGAETTTTFINIGEPEGSDPPDLTFDLAPGETVDVYQTVIDGRTSPGATVTVNDVEADVDEHGVFRFDDVWSQPGENTLVVTATNPDGSTRTAAVPFLFEPPEGWAVFVGDSLTVGATSEIEERFVGARINARTSRPFGEGVDAVIDMVDRPDGPQLLVVNLGANGGATDERMDRIMEVAALVPRVLFVNLRIDRGWESETNAIIEAGVDRYDNAFLVDWHTAATGNEDVYLRSDLVHLTPAGNAALLDLIEEAAWDGV